ncbi:PC-esterase domain-containing protein 1B isoform X1 [Heterocephalus glaber]|uniref:PC-esterase domain-containing protein 1B isoform X1 n=1 Tax=Heterocephalus glaber TaxID=10181 RepID=A0AAX6PGS4_HETGA|nr:PC-esterase domain-containing protein 1B isoform X1 [Heterocephalus glaber]
MAHLRTCEVRQLLHNKFVVVMGDSIQRAVYKDLVLLLQKDCLLSSRQLKTTGELSFEHDMLLEGGRWGPMHNNIYYREVRQFCTGHHLVRFYFLTRAYSAYLEDVLSELRRGEHAPDLVVLNSCLWDLSRHGRHFPTRYREDLECLFRRMDRVLPESCLLVWNTALPVANTVSGGLLPPGALARLVRLSEDVMEANFYSSFEASRRGFDLLDLHFHFRLHAGQHQLRDGVHWDEHAHRRLSQLLLAHVADAWGVNLPGRDSAAEGGREGTNGSDRRLAAEHRRQPRDSRGDPQEPAASWRSEPLLRGPRQLSMLCPQAPASFRLYPEDGHLPSDPPAQEHFNLSDSSRRQVEYSRGVNSRAGREPIPGLIRRVYTQHPRRVSSPYPAQHLAGSQERLRHRRHSSRQIQHAQSQE